MVREPVMTMPTMVARQIKINMTNHTCTVQP